MAHSEIGHLTQKHDPRNGFEYSEAQKAEARFRVAAWNLRIYQLKHGENSVPFPAITEYEESRHALQGMGWSEDGIDAMERQTIQVQSAKWKVTVV